MCSMWNTNKVLLEKYINKQSIFRNIFAFDYKWKRMGEGVGVREWVMFVNILQNEFICIVIAYYCNHFGNDKKKLANLFLFKCISNSFCYVYIEKKSAYWWFCYIDWNCTLSAVPLHFESKRDRIHNCLFNFQYMNQLIFVVET